MAVKLNKTRIRDSKIILIATLITSFISSTSFEDGTFWHETMEQIGYILISICVIGRVYATAFLGGFKNDKLITVGPFSVVRNPLYAFSLIGILGIGSMSNHIVVMIGLPIIFLIMYHFLIKREEEFLTEKFGSEYTGYCSRTPRLIPNFKLYHVPETVQMAPRYLNKALADSCWWIAIFPAMEAVDLLHNYGYFKPLFFLP
jgi:protein-S-isoprenylcysteine O-methyltransferase Ste14